MSSPEARYEDLARALHVARPVATAGLRERVGAISAREPEPRLPRIAWRRAALLAPACILALIGYAVVHGLATGTSPERSASSGASGGAASTVPLTKVPAPGAESGAKLRADRPGAGATPKPYGAQRQLAPVVTHGAATSASPVALPPSGIRLQDYSASLRIHVTDLDRLSTATKTAMRVTRGYGGYVSSVDYGTPGGKRGEADLLLRVPVARVQDAIMRFSQLGTILAQQVSVRDVQGQVNDETRRIVTLRRQIAVIEAALENRSLTNEARARLQVQLVGQKATLAAVLREQRATIKQARLSTISLALTTARAAAVVKPHHRGRLGRALHDAGSILAKEAAVALYALVLVGPLLLLAAAALAGGRLLRRRGEQRLLEQS